MHRLKPKRPQKSTQDIDLRISSIGFASSYQVWSCSTYQLNIGSGSGRFLAIFDIHDDSLLFTCCCCKIVLREALSIVMVAASFSRLRNYLLFVGKVHNRPRTTHGFLSGSVSAAAEGSGALQYKSYEQKGHKTRGDRLRTALFAR